MLKKLNALLRRAKPSYSLGIVILALVLIALFYWFQWRPSEIRKDCVRYANEHVKVETGSKEIDIDKFIKANDFVYKDCLKARGQER